MEIKQRTGGRDQIMYTETALVRVARRENNNKRKYLVVNRLQGKHIPAKPCEALAMFRALADVVKGRFGREKLLVIGFAETATAVGAAVAAELGADYADDKGADFRCRVSLFFGGAQPCDGAKACQG